MDSRTDPSPHPSADSYLDEARVLLESEPGYWDPATLPDGQMILNLGPQHPATHGVLRLEVLCQGEHVVGCQPHIGYLHRCFEAHAQQLPYPQIIPFVDRLDYVGAICGEHVYAGAIETMLGLTGQLEPRTEYIRILVAELARVGSHCLAIGTFGIDVGAFTPFLWLMREREHITRLLEWATGARLLQNYIWIGGLYQDLPPGFERACRELCDTLPATLDQVGEVLLDNEIFIRRTANVGVLPLDEAIAGGASGPVLRASGLAHDLRRLPGQGYYHELDWQIPVGSGARGRTGDTWDRTWCRWQECYVSLSMIRQCLDALETARCRPPGYDPRGQCPKKIRPEAQTLYYSGETARGALGFAIEADGRSEVPIRCHARSPSAVHLSLIPRLAPGMLIADLLATVGSMDVVMGEVDR